MESMAFTSGSHFRSIKIIHFGLVTGVVFFIIVVLLVQFKGFGTFSEDIKVILLVVTSVFTFFGVFAGQFAYKKKIEEGKSKSRLIEKLDIYRSALIIKLALIEGPSFFAVVSYLLTGCYIFPGIALLLIVVFLMYRPTPDNFIMDLDLSPDEAAIVNNPEAIID
jgi:hypothetical protein